MPAVMARPAARRPGAHPLVMLSIDDVGENTAMVNALQRHATVVAQNSLAEGFGLTVSEGM
jgi:trehalose synthase